MVGGGGSCSYKCIRNITYDFHESCHISLRICHNSRATLVRRLGARFTFANKWCQCWFIQSSPFIPSSLYGEGGSEIKQWLISSQWYVTSWNFFNCPRDFWPALRLLAETYNLYFILVYSQVPVSERFVLMYGARLCRVSAVFRQLKMRNRRQQRQC